MSQSPGQVDIFAIEKDSPVKSADTLECLPADKQTSTAAPVRFHRDGVVDLRMLALSQLGGSKVAICGSPPSVSTASINLGKCCFEL